MSKTLLDAPIYIDTYKLAGRLYDLRFALPKRDRAVLGERMFDAVMAMLADFTMSYKLRGVDKIVHTDKFLAHFEVLKGLIRICCDKKLYGGDKACKGLFGVSQEDKAKFLSVIPELRKRLAGLKVSLNERKFYLQHYSKGVRILGIHVRYDREILDRSTVRRAFRKVEEWKRVNGIQWKTDRLLSSMNTYVGMMKHKTMRRTTERFRDCVLDAFGRFLGWNPQKECFCLKEKYTLKRVLERKYKVRL